MKKSPGQTLESLRNHCALLNADMIIAVSRAFAIPEINGPFDIPAGVVIFDSRAIDSSDVSGDAQVDETFLGGITIEFDTSYPTSFNLPLSINPVTTWPGPIFSGRTEIASLNATFSTFTQFFFTKHLIDKEAQVAHPAGSHMVLGIGSEVYELFDTKMTYMDASAFCKKHGASLAPVSSDMGELLASMACEDADDKCWVGGNEKGGCQFVMDSEYARGSCDQELKFVCFRE
eukprot:gene3698-13767_t